MESLTHKTASGFMYKFMERAGAKGFNFVISLLLARLILPEEYGGIALIAILISLCDVFVVSGFGNSLIVDQDSDIVDFSTCFFFGLAFSAVLYLGVFFSAQAIADYYHYPSLVPVIRVMAIRIPIASVNSVQQAYVSKHMQFRKFFYATLIGTVISGIIAVIMAYAGCGVWALVEQSLGNVIIDTICLWIIVGWRPKLVFSFARLKKIYRFGWKILAVGLLDKGYAQLRSLVIARKYSSSDLAYYQKGMQFPQFGMNIIEPTISGVIFPALSKCNDDMLRMKKVVRKVIKASTYLIFPTMIGLAITAEPLVRLLLTEKWIDCVEYLQIGCVAYMFRPIQVLNNSIIKASKQSGLLLKLDILKKSIGIALVVASIPFGIHVIAWSYVVTNVISTFINIFPNRRLMQYGYKDQFLDIFANLGTAVLMGACVYCVTFLGLSSIMTLAVQIMLGVCLYLVLSFAFHLEGFYALKGLLKKENKN